MKAAPEDERTASSEAHKLLIIDSCFSDYGHYLGVAHTKYERKTAPFVTTIESGGYQITIDVNLPNTVSMLILLLSVHIGSSLVNTH